jgi:hypothetical protein
VQVRHFLGVVGQALQAAGYANVAIWSQHGRVAVVVLCCVVLWSCCCCDAYGDALCGGLSVWAGRRGPWPVGRQLGLPVGEASTECRVHAHRPPPTALCTLAVCTLRSALCALRWSGLCRACRLAIDSEMRCRLGVAMMASSSTVVSRAADYAATSAGTAEAQCKRSAACLLCGLLSRRAMATERGTRGHRGTGSRPLAACFAARALTASRWASSRSLQGSSARLLQYYCRSTAGLQQRYCTTCRLLVEACRR